MKLSLKQTLGVLCIPVLAVSLTLKAYADTDTLAPYEQSLFSSSYTEETLSERLNRLEQSVFGEIQAGTEIERQTRLLNALKSIPSIGKSGPSPVEIEPEGEDTSAAQPHPVASRPNKDATDYPTVTALERSIFGREFTHDDISIRLTRLEKRALGTSSPEMAMVDRVDRLLSKYPEAKSGVVTPPRWESTTNSVLKQLPSDSRQFAGSTGDVYAKVEALEQRILTHPSNPKLMLTERLDQLEQQAYGKAYSGESIDTRVNRLMSQFMAVKATGQPTSKMTSEQPQIIYNSSSAYPQSTRQNVQIGAGFAQNSQYQFSQDMMDMLPNDVRSQLQSQTNSGTVISAPSTVIIEQSKTTQYPGFQPYGSQPLQYYNYYGSSPSTSVQSQTTTVIQPNGTSVVYGYNAPGGLPNPAYVGDPAFLQQLNSVEANVFGRVDTMLPVQNRLYNLEMAILGKAQPQLPEVERLNAIFRSWKIQQISQVITPGKKTTLGIPLNPSKK